MPKVDIRAAAYLVTRVIGKVAARRPLLDAMPLALAAGSMSWIGAAAVWGAEPPPAAGMTVRERAAAASAGYRALMDVPGVLLPILDALVANRTRVNVPKIASYYGCLHKRLSYYSHPTLDALKDIVARHAASTFPRTGVGGVFGSESLQQERITFGAAARQWKLRDGEARSIACMLGVEVASRRKMQEIAVADCTRVQAWLTARIGLKEARQILGLSAKMSYHLQDGGIIERAGDSRKLHRAYYERAAIEQLVADVRRDAPVVEVCDPDCTTLAGAARPFLGLAALVRALLEGKLAPCGVLSSKRGLAAVLVRSADVLRLFTAADDGMVTATEAAHFLCMPNTGMISELIKHGLLSARYPGGSVKNALL